MGTLRTVLVGGAIVMAVYLPGCSKSSAPGGSGAPVQVPPDQEKQMMEMYKQSQQPAPQSSGAPATPVAPRPY